jgi:hypothetical protein
VDIKINPVTKCIEFSDSIMLNETVKEYHQIKLSKENIKYLNKKYSN